MIFHPLIISLLVASAMACFLILYAASFGAQILRRWDLQSGSELQLRLERKTFLISTLLAFLFAAQLLSFFLFIFTADRIHPYFVGAMCAAGSLNVNGFGYPTLLLKLVNFVFAGLWLILNAVDVRGYDYPLIKTKYRLLLPAAPLILAEAVSQASYFLRLKPDIITSCCGTLFSSAGEGRSSDLASLPVPVMKIVLFLSLSLTAAAGLVYYLKRRGGRLFAALSGTQVIISILSILSFISIYIYELPTHHCPFCLLQAEYGFVGYPIYFSALGAGICGLGVGLLTPFRKIKSLASTIPSVQRRLALAAVILLLLFAAIVIIRLAFSDLVLPKAAGT
jgi:hypothetical protein